MHASADMQGKLWPNSVAIGQSQHECDTAAAVNMLYSLYARPKFAYKNINSGPAAVQKDPSRFIELFRKTEKFALPLSQLYEWGDWLTPYFGSLTENTRRFDTVFYVLHVPEPCDFRLSDRELQTAEVKIGKRNF